MIVCPWNTSFAATASALSPAHKKTAPVRNPASSITERGMRARRNPWVTPPLGSCNASHGATASAPQVDHWQPRCLRHGLLQTARSPNPAHTHCLWHAAPGFTLLSSANPALIARQHVHRERPTGSTCRQMTMPVLASPRRCPRGACNPTWQGRTPTLGLPWSHRA